MPAKSSEHPHNGHRERLRERFLKGGAEGFADHELLELLLFYAIPRRDTNELAHSLIEECGSLSDVLEADAEQLQSVSGVKEQTSLYLSVLGELARRYAVSKFTTEQDPMKTVYDTPEKLAAVVYPRFLGQTRESMLALLFDSGMHLVDLFTVARGSLNSVQINIRTVVQRAYRRGAASVILAHNHPGGVAMPSPDDIELTRSMQQAFQLLGIPLVEHFVFTEHAYFPIMTSCSLGAEEKLSNPQAAQFRRLITGKKPL